MKDVRSDGRVPRRSNRGRWYHHVPALRSLIRWESVVIAVRGTVLGLAIGVFFGWAIVTAPRRGERPVQPAGPEPGRRRRLSAMAGVAAAIGPSHRVANLNVLGGIGSE